MAKIIISEIRPCQIHYLEEKLQSVPLMIDLVHCFGDMNQTGLYPI